MDSILINSNLEWICVSHRTFRDADWFATHFHPNACAVFAFSKSKCVVANGLVCPGSRRDDGVAAELLERPFSHSEWPKHYYFNKWSRREKHSKGGRWVCVGCENLAYVYMLHVIRIFECRLLCCHNGTAFSWGSDSSAKCFRYTLDFNCSYRRKLAHDTLFVSLL